MKREINDVVYLPASRSGLYQALNAFSMIIVELSKKRNFLTKSITLPSISEPLSDYFLRLSDINLKKGRNFDTELDEIVRLLEDDLLKGEVIFDDKIKKIIYKPKNLNLELDISMASSMISEISPIVAYLKYILVDTRMKGNPNSKFLLFIEEPESHLHPEAQIKITEIFSKLVQKNIKLIITSHSNYVFNKLNNLIIKKSVDHKKVACYLMDMGEQGSVSHNIPIDEVGIDDLNFGYVSEKLYEEKLTLIDELNELQENKNAK